MDWGSGAKKGWSTPGERAGPSLPDDTYPRLGSALRPGDIVKPNIKLGYLAALFCAVIAPVALAAQQTAADPFIWLEDIDGKRSMDWVNAHNASTVAELTASPLYQAIYD